MTYARFEELPETEYVTKVEFPYAVLSFDGPYREVRKALALLPRRRWTWPLAKNLYDQNSDSDGRNTVQAFFVARKLGHEAFLIRDPKDVRQTAVNIGTGDAATLVFSLPTSKSSERSMHYPFDSSSVLNSPAAATVVRKNGVVQTLTTHYTIQTDARTITFVSAPAMGHAIEIDYDFYRLARFASEELSWSKPASVFATAAPDIVETLD